MRYLLDTNIVSHLLRDPHGKCRSHILRVGIDNVCTSLIVLAEVRFGIEKVRSQKLSRRLDLVLEDLTVLPLLPPVDVNYASLRAKLEVAGSQIGANDMLIAAHVMTLGATLATDNVAEFSRVDGLLVENWLR